MRASFDRVWAVSSLIASLFYDRLFEIAPQVRPLFSGDLDEQKRNFMSTLAVIVGSLDDGTRLLPLTDRLAQPHRDYGIRPAHYAFVGDALLWSLQQGLGTEWTPSVAASWNKAYATVSRLMIENSRSNR